MDVLLSQIGLSFGELMVCVILASASISLVFDHKISPRD